MLNALVQTEKLYTINFFKALTWGDWNSVSLLSVILVAAWLVIYLFHLGYRQGRQSFLSAAWWLLFLLWLPLALSSWLTHYNLAAQAVGQAAAPVADKWQSRLCQVDENQNFGGLICHIGSTVKAVKERIKDPASLCQIVNGNAYPFFLYGLYGVFDMPVGCQTADYVLVYLSAEDLSYFPGSQQLTITKVFNGATSTINCGRFEPPQVLGDGIFLLKRLF